MNNQELAGFVENVNGVTVLRACRIEKLNLTLNQ